MRWKDALNQIEIGFCRPLGILDDATTVGIHPCQSVLCFASIGGLVKLDRSGRVHFDPDPKLVHLAQQGRGDSISLIDQRLEDFESFRRITWSAGATNQHLSTSMATIDAAELMPLAVPLAGKAKIQPDVEYLVILIVIRQRIMRI